MSIYDLADASVAGQIEPTFGGVITKRALQCDVAPDNGQGAQNSIIINNPFTSSRRWGVALQNAETAADNGQGSDLSFLSYLGGNLRGVAMTLDRSASAIQGTFTAGAQFVGIPQAGPDFTIGTGGRYGNAGTFIVPFNLPAGSSAAAVTALVFDTAVAAPAVTPWRNGTYFCEFFSADIAGGYCIFTITGVPSTPDPVAGAVATIAVSTPPFNNTLRLVQAAGQTPPAAITPLFATAAAFNPGTGNTTQLIVNIPTQPAGNTSAASNGCLAVITRVA